MNFGATVKSLRVEQGKTLRQFCSDHGHDPSNWSKIERGVSPPPRNEQTLSAWAIQLGLTRGSKAWSDFMEKATICRGEIPGDILSDEALVDKLPVFFRAIRGVEMTEDQLDDFIRTVKEIHTPNVPQG